MRRSIQDACHYKNYACSISSARDDCCGAPGDSGACQLDRLGVPRCGAAGACNNPGGACSSSNDCCNTLPCVADSSGAFKCGGNVCAPKGGSCTINGDCCAGTTCVTKLGSTSGTCNGPPPPVGTGGSSGACAQYAQSCKIKGNCCAGVLCTGGFCVFPSM